MLSASEIIDLRLKRDKIASESADRKALAAMLEKFNTVLERLASAPAPTINSVVNLSQPDIVQREIKMERNEKGQIVTAKVGERTISLMRNAENQIIGAEVK